MKNIMKKAITLFSILILSVMVYSQNYYPLIEEDKTWNVLSVVLVSINPPFDTTFSTLSYKLNGDTIINTETYKKMYLSTEEIPTNWSLWCFMREDTDKRVWLKKNAEEDEFLMYDFLINEGDSIQVGYMEPVYLYVDSITEVTINETQRQKFWMSCKIMPDYRETWIEGIGSNKGIVWSGSAFIIGGWYWLLCMSESGELIYMNPNYNSCYLNSTGITEKNNTIIKVYPNPTKSIITLEIPKQSENCMLEIIDVYGNVLIKTEPNNPKEVIDIQALKSGFYIYMLRAKGLYKTGKIVVRK